MRRSVIDGELTLREAKFCQCYFACGDGERAYLESYNAGKKRAPWVRLEAHRLLKKPHIRKRISELIEKNAEKAVYDRDMAMLEAGEAYYIAEQQRDVQGMLKATELKAKLNGLLISTQAHQRTIRDIPTDELRRDIRELQKRLALDGILEGNIGDASPRETPLRPQGPAKKLTRPNEG